jgi:hypothetical protein
MTLTSPLSLSRHEVKQATVLALDTGCRAESLEGLRLVKASRGSGWFFDGATLVPWATQGVLQDGGRLVVWGELAAAPEGTSPTEWPLTDDFRRAFAAAWTALEAGSLGAFGPSSAVPLKTASGWAFAFLPPELAGVLDSVRPLSERLTWEHVAHPDLRGEAAWAFTSAALSLAARVELPWLQDDESSLRQEIRELKKTLRDAELPEASESVRKLWLESLKGTGTAAVWKSWSQTAETAPPGDAERERQRLAAGARRLVRRSRSAFWRRRGTLVTVIAASSAVLLAVAASMIWGWLKPDPTDTWTPEQVVRGYYQGLSTLDGMLLRKITSFDHFREPTLVIDQDQSTNLYVLKQVRTAYEKVDPIVDAATWETQGKPELQTGQQLYGLAGLTVEGAGDTWTAHYRRWVSEGGGSSHITVTGTSNTDKLKLVRTGRGWKIASLTRESQPLP